MIKRQKNLIDQDEFTITYTYINQDWFYSITIKQDEIIKK